MWLFRFPARPNEFPHSAHLYTFSPVWVIMCLLRSLACPNDFLHSEQVWIFSPLWVSMCAFRESARPNDLLHWTQACALSLLWVIMCLFRSLDRPNDFWHSEQIWILSPLEVRDWLAISLYLSVDLSAPWRLSNWKIWNFPVPVQRLGHFYFSIFMVKQTTNYFSLSVSIEDKNDEGMEPSHLNIEVLIETIYNHSWLW